MSDDFLDQVKAVVADPGQAPAVHDLLHHAVAEMVAAVNGDDFPMDADFSDEELARRTTAFEALAAPLVRASAWGGFYASPATRTLWPSLVGCAANTVIRTGGHHDVWRHLHRYPAILMTYAAGIGAVAGDRPQLTSREYTLIAEPQILYFRDIYDHLIRLTDDFDSYRELVAATIEVYLSTINNNLSAIMKRLTGVTVVLAGIGAVGGVFGMSQATPAIAGQEGFGFYSVTVITVIVAAIAVSILRRIDWV